MPESAVASDCARLSVRETRSEYTRFTIFRSSPKSSTQRATDGMSVACPCDAWSDPSFGFARQSGETIIRS